MHSYVKEQHKCIVAIFSVQNALLIRRIDNVGDDCPVFDGLFEYCSISAGGSIGMVLINIENYANFSQRGPQD